jgi:hypothetical protein
VGTRRIRRAIRLGRYEFTLHAIDEMEKDELFELDVVTALATGRLIVRLARDPRGTRFVVRGRTDDGQIVEVVCRFPPSGRLRIITAYRLES